MLTLSIENKLKDVVETPPGIITVANLFKMNLTVPEYQRPYKWKARNVIQLLDDILEGMLTRKVAIRLGTAIFHNPCEHLLNIVDGQQRLVTITLILSYLNGQINLAQNLPLLHCKFPHSDSKNNIRINYKVIEDWFNNNSNVAKPKFTKYLLENCEFVKMELSDISETFQLFDSQNSRGKALEPFDLLKAFHLREMRDETELDKLMCVERWEGAVNSGQLQILGKYVYRIRKWARGEKSYEFTKENIDEFKGINLKEFKTYPYLRSHLLTDALISEMNKRPVNEFIYGDVRYPFQITQMIINGKRFFEFVDFYANLHLKLFKEEENEFLRFYKKHCLYPGSLRIGDKYVREMYESSILYYKDKFGDTNFKEASVALFKWSYVLRLNKTRIQYRSIDKHIAEDKNINIFSKINLAYHTNEIMKCRISDRTDDYSINEVMEVFSQNI